MSQTATSGNGNGSQTFADFMYAVVVGVAFSDIELTSGMPALLATAFLLLVVIEDFYLYQTQVKPHTDVFNFISFSSLLFEVGILAAWYLAFNARHEFIRVSLGCYAGFFVLKWFASVKHSGKAKQLNKAWIVNRDHLFLISVAVAAFLILVGDALSDGVKWAAMFAVWFAQTAIWWRLVAPHPALGE